MSIMSAAQRRKIFMLSKEKGLDDGLMHEYIHKVTGKKSLKDLSISDAIKVIDGLEGKKQNADYMISSKQMRYIEGLAVNLGWVDEDNQVDKSRLYEFIDKRFHVSDIAWLTSKIASQVIEALKDMNARNKKAV